MTALWQDVRLAARRLARMRSAAVLAIAALGLGVGATTTMFSVVYAALLRPLPFHEPDRLVMVYLTRASASASSNRIRFSWPEFRALQAGARSFDAVGSFSRSSLAVELPEPEQIDGEVISASYLPALRVVPLAGRLFTPEEDTPSGAHAVALISARLWRDRLAADPAVLGRTLTANGVPLTVVGVLPDRFAGLSGRADVWLPATMAPRLTYAEYLTTPQHFVSAVARLKAGVSLAQANAELAALGGRIANAGNSDAGPPARRGATSVPIGEARVDPSVRRSSVLLLDAIACVLLIACANVASLLLARVRHRRRELAVSRAIGASAWRIARQLVAESLLLAGAGGAVGAFASIWGIRMIAAVAPDALPSTQTGYVQLAGFAVPGLDGPVLLFALVASVAAGVLVGVMPALEASRTDLMAALHDDQRATGAGRARVLGALVIGEMALAVLLLAGAGLLTESVQRMMALRAGVASDRVIAFRILPPASRYAPEMGPAILERVLARVTQTPGVAAAAVNRCTPLTSSCAWTTLFLPGPRVSDADAPVVERHYISSDYFRVLGIPVKLGRALTDADRQGRPPVTVINEAAARKFWPGRNPLGERVWFGSSTGFTDPANPVQVVGVVADVKYALADDAIGPDFYTSYLQFAYPDSVVIVQSAREDALSLVPSLRAAVASVDRALPIYDVGTLDDRMNDALSRPRFNARTLVIFAGAALFLAALGVYGVMAYSVSTRRTEIGIRLALGADGGMVVRLILRESARLALAGGAIGVIAALMLGRVLRSFLFDVSPGDPWALGLAAGVLMAAALAAAWAPARRAGAVDPIVTLRSQ